MIDGLCIILYGRIVLLLLNGRTFILLVNIGGCVRCVYVVVLSVAILYFVFFLLLASAVIFNDHSRMTVTVTVTVRPYSSL